MCRPKPYLRCSTHARVRRDKALARMEACAPGSQQYTVATRQFEEAQAEYDPTSAGFKELLAQLSDAQGEERERLLARARMALQRREEQKQYSNLRKQIRGLLPQTKRFAPYYEATEAKHFGDASVAGSTFTDPQTPNLAALLEQAAQQRDTLEGDDREALIADGASPESFREGIRYLRVETQGTVGVISSAKLPSRTLVEVARMKPNAPCSLVVEVDTQPTTTMGTIIIGPRADTPSKEMLYTAHPGVPTPVDGQDRMAQWEGQRVPLSLVKKMYGSDVWLNTRVKDA